MITWGMSIRTNGIVMYCIVITHVNNFENGAVLYFLILHWLVWFIYCDRENFLNGKHFIGSEISQVHTYTYYFTYAEKSQGDKEHMVNYMFRIIQLQE